jgi:hypothetical protein
MKETNVSTPSPSIAYMESKRELTRAIMSGTMGMREAGKKWLPQHPAEDDKVYRVRLQKTFLDNFVEMAIDKASGKLFSKEIEVENLLPEIETLIENIDRQGRALDPFFLDVAKTAFQDGISYVMADMPKTDGVQTLADEKKSGVRPYAIHVKPESVLETLSEMTNGIETLTRVRIMEVVSEPNDKWGYTSTEQVRVWYREEGVVRWETYRQNDKKEWIIYEEGTTTFKAIYLIPFYTNRTGYMAGLPPFQNVAESNLEHWNWKSEHAHALSMCCFGMYTATGVPDDFVLGVGPAKSHTTSNPEAKFGVLETSGEGVGLAENVLKAIESRIESAGVDLRVENQGKVTATAAALDSEDTNAGLKAVAQGFSDSIESLLMAFAEIMGLDANNAGEASVNDDFGQRHGTDAGLQELGKARALGDLSRPQYHKIMKWRGEYPEAFDIDVNEEELRAEPPDLSVME